MKLKITSSDVDGASVVVLEGRIVLGEESETLREKVKSLIVERNKNIVLNMDQVAYIDSTGLGILVALHVGARNQGATLKLSNLSARFHEILRITKLVKVFEVYNTEAVAVAS
jgi:anti-sigma B factor antagonist